MSLKEAFEEVELNIKRDRGFTLIEIMIVILIMAIIFSVAMYSYMGIKRKGQMYACIGNLRQIDNAKTCWAMDNGDKEGSDILVSDLVPGYLKKEPVCPSDGIYRIGNLQEAPECTSPGHVLPGNS